MEIQKYINQKKELYETLLCFLDNENVIQNDFEKLINFIDTQKIAENRNDFNELLLLISKISKNHHKNSSFSHKIEQILLFFHDKIKQTFSNLEIFNFFQKNLLILLFLLKQEIITIDDSILPHILENKKYRHFFYDEIKFKIDEKTKKQIETELFEIDKFIFCNFKEKCESGENDSYISTLIRNDSVEEFITYVNQTNLSISKTTIKPSIFETNSFLINKKPTLIEYAAFFGSIKIFRYLRINKVKLNPSLWLYSIHGRNPDLIHLLEESHVEPEDDSYEKYLKESIKCHHNEIAVYIQNTLLSKKMTNNDEIHLFLLDHEDEENDFYNKFDENINSYSFRYHNYEFFPDDFNDDFYIFYLCQYNYFNLVDLLLKSKNIDLHKKIILNYFLTEF